MTKKYTASTRSTALRSVRSRAHYRVRGLCGWVCTRFFDGRWALLGSGSAAAKYGLGRRPTRYISHHLLFHALMRRKKKTPDVNVPAAADAHPTDTYAAISVGVIFAFARATVVFVGVVDWRAFGGVSGAGIRESRPIRTSLGPTHIERLGRSWDLRCPRCFQTGC